MLALKSKVKCLQFHIEFRIKVALVLPTFLDTDLTKSWTQNFPFSFYPFPSLRPLCLPSSLPPSLPPSIFLSMFYDFTRIADRKNLAYHFWKLNPFKDILDLNRSSSLDLQAVCSFRASNVNLRASVLSCVSFLVTRLHLSDGVFGLWFTVETFTIRGL